MSRNVLEKLIWQLCVDRNTKERFREDPRRLLKRYALTEQEATWVLEFDVKSLQAHGVNSMLTMGFWQELSPTRDMAAYHRQLGATESDASAFSASLKH